MAAMNVRDLLKEVQRVFCELAGRSTHDPLWASACAQTFLEWREAVHDSEVLWLYIARLPCDMGTNCPRPKLYQCLPCKARAIRTVDGLTLVERNTLCGGS